MIDPGIPARYTVDLGKSFGRAGNKLLSVRYNFKPESIDTSRPGKLSGGPKMFDIEWNSTQSDKPHLFVSGIPSHGKDVDCCLVFNPKTGKFSLEIIDMFMRFNQDRSKRKTSNSIQFPVRTTPTLSDTESGKCSPFLQSTKRSPPKTAKLLASPPGSALKPKPCQRIQKPVSGQKSTATPRKPPATKTVASKKLPTPPPTGPDSPKGLGLEMPSGLAPMELDFISQTTTDDTHLIPPIRKPKVKRSTSPESEESSSESEDSDESDANDSEDDLDDLANMLEEDLVQENSSGGTPTFPPTAVNGLNLAPRSMSDLARF